MITPVACNYATIQFLPYRETGEFVNIGVLLFCPQTGYFNAKIETRKQDRVTNFFPEINEDVFRNARQFFEAELQRVQTALANDRRTPSEQLAVFRELVKPRESMFRFGGIATHVFERQPDGSLKLKLHTFN